MSINRRRFLVSSGVTAFGALALDALGLPSISSTADPFQWNTSDLVFTFDVTAGRLRQKRLVPVDFAALDNSSGVEVALQCSGENSPDQGMKSGTGQPGVRLLFAGKREESTRRGKRLVCTHTDSNLKLRVESFYESFDGLPVDRKSTRLNSSH